MKISITLDQVEQIAAVAMRLSRSPAIGAKDFSIAADGTVVLNSSVLKASIEMWLQAQGHTVSDSDVETIGADGTVTIAVTQAAVLTPVPLPPVALVPVPLPVATVPPVAALPIQGHLVVIDPPLSATGKCTMFGLDWDGSKDPEDNQEGFFTDPSTGQSYNTGVQSLLGVSLPREVLMSSFGITDSWRIPALSDANTSAVWAKNAAAVRQFAVSHKVTFTIDSGGLSVVKAVLVDAGPEAIGKNGDCIGNMADFTYATAHALNTNGEAVATLEMLVNGAPVEIRGWDFVNKRVG